MALREVMSEIILTRHDEHKKIIFQVLNGQF